MNGMPRLHQGETFTASVRINLLSALSDSLEPMFDSFELPPPEAVAGMDDLGLLDAMEVAAVLETLAVDVQVAVFKEICRRRVRGTAGTHPAPPRPRALASSTRRRRRRKARKRRRRH
jgi:hypothetical protein